MEILTQQEYEEFDAVRKKQRLDADAQDLIARLHAKYYKHQYYKPCSCSGKTWQQWISQLNDLYDNGYQQGSST